MSESTKRSTTRRRTAPGLNTCAFTLVANGQEKYLVSDDDKVDAAVVDFGAMKYSQNDYDFVPMELAVFASADEIAKLGIGDSIASAGLIPGRSGEKRNYPLVRAWEYLPVSLTRQCGQTATKKCQH